MTARTLSRWVDRLLDGRVVIECPHMEIIGRDHEPPVFTGPGHIVIEADTRIHFVMHGTPCNGQDAWTKYLAAQGSVYDVHQQFRLNAVAHNGQEWSCGWTVLSVDMDACSVWRLSGGLNSLHTSAEGFGVSEKAGVELVFDQKLRIPIPMNMMRTVVRDGKQVLLAHSHGSKKVQALDANIEFFHQPESEHLWVAAETSSRFPHPYLENWIYEPLSMLLGQFAFPRLVARNFGGERATISVRSVLKESMDNVSASILCSDPLASDERFWAIYQDMLALVASSKDEHGHPNFEAHPLTKYYWEVIRASKGTNWVLCMTLASTIEGIAKRMFSESERKSDWSDSDVEGLKSAIKAWKGNNDLRSVVLNSSAFQKTKGVAKSLRSLINDGCITREHVDAWQSLRNSSMHGEMVVPWEDEKQEARIQSLIEMTHRLSETYIYRELEKLGVARA